MTLNMVVTLSFHFYTLQIPWDKRQLTADCATTRTVHTTICEAVRNKTGHLREGHRMANPINTSTVTGMHYTFFQGLLNIFR